MPHVYQLESKNWRAVYRDRTGRRHSITRPTKSEAEAEAKDRESEIRRGTWRDPELGRTTFETWLERWLTGRVVEGNTTRKNRSHLDNHILPAWRTAKLDGIDELSVQQWVARMRKAGVGAATIKEAHALFSTIMSAAASHGLIPVNPAKGTRLPAVPKQPFRILGEEEATAILGNLEGADWRMVKLTHRLGLRWGEVAGLHDHRIDVRRRELHVVEVLTRHDGIKAYPKSSMSRRTLPLTDNQADMLAEQITGKGVVFPGLDYSNWRRRVWLPAVEKAKLDDPQPTFHDLRHTAASNLVEDGMDLASVQAFMGHESLTTTARYVHVSGRSRERIRASLSARDN